MTGCFTSNLLRLGLRPIPILAIVAVLTPALAQQAPRPLLPDRPLNLQTAPAPAPADSMPSKPGTTAVKSDIAIDALDAVATENVGALDAAAGGFDIELWADTPRRIIEQLMVGIPRTMPSPALRDLRRRLLLSVARIPPATSPVTGSLVLKRARILFDAGDFRSLERLFAQVSVQHHEEPLAQLKANMALLSDDLPHACVIAAGWLDRSQDFFWQKLRIFCDAMAGAIERVDLGMQMLGELGVEDDMFFALMPHLVGRSPDHAPVVAGPLRALDIAILRGAQGQLPEPDDPDALPLAYLPTYLQASSDRAAIRIALAERGERFGLVDVADLARIYQPEETGPAGGSRAARYRAALAQTSIFGQAQAIMDAGMAAAEEGQIGQTARLFAPLIRTMQPEPELGWFSPMAATILLADNDHVGARHWIGLAKREAPFDTEVQAAWFRAWPLVRLAAGDALTEWDPAGLQNWRMLMKESDPESELAKTVLLYGLMDALGDPVPPTVWRTLIDPVRPRFGQTADIVTLRALSAARDAGRVGEAVALVLVAIGESVPLSSPPLVLCDAVRTLKGLGLEDDARRLAFEIAIASGL